MGASDCDFDGDGDGDGRKDADRQGASHPCTLVVWLSGMSALLSTYLYELHLTWCLLPALFPPPHPLVKNSLAQGHNGRTFAITVRWVCVFVSVCACGNVAECGCSPLCQHILELPLHGHDCLFFHFFFFVLFNVFLQVSRLSAVVKLPEFVKIKCNMPWLTQLNATWVIVGLLRVHKLGYL